MKVSIWGSRGSIASAGPETVRYGGNTASVSVESDAVVCLLDAGSGMRRAGVSFAADDRPIHVLLTHLHMDHIQGLGFLGPLFDPGRRAHLWGPPSATQDLRTRLTRYLSPPLFPVRIRDFDARVELHDAPLAPWMIEDIEVSAATVIHPGSTLGYRVRAGRRSVAYLPDHEPALGGDMRRGDWTSGYDLAERADVLIHDGQYTAEEYERRIGWGHSSVEQAIAFADLADAERLVLFHHDPDHSDDVVDEMLAAARAARRGPVDAACEGMTIEL